MATSQDGECIVDDICRSRCLDLNRFNQKFLICVCFVFGLSLTTRHEIMAQTTAPTSSKTTVGKPSSRGRVLKERQDLKKKKGSTKKSPSKVKSKAKRKNRSTKSEPSLTLSQLRSSYERELKRPELTSAKAGWIIRDLMSGEVVVEHNANVLFHPASCTKIVTTVAAFRVFGSDMRFVTRFYLDEGRAAQPPDLYWYASGDPKIVPETFTSIATELRTLLLKRKLPMEIGDLIIDDSLFTQQVLAPGYEQKPEDDSAYRSPNGGVGFQFNRFSVTFKPSKKVGDPPAVSINPPIDYFQVMNTAKTTSRGKERLSLFARANPESQTMSLEVKGQIPLRNRSVSVRRRIADPLRFSGESLLYFLQKNGIKSKGSVRRGKLKEGLEASITHRSPPMRDLIKDVNAYSNNFMAEQLLLAMGLKVRGFGGWVEGALVVKSILDAEIGIKGYQYHNGSGLFGETSMSPHMITEVLIYAHKQSEGKFGDLLAEPGRPGTLKHRFKSLPRGALSAKTGTLDQVSTLCGYLTSRQGRRLVFCFMMNDYRVETSSIRSIQDEMLRYAWLTELPSEGVHK